MNSSVYPNNLVGLQINGQVIDFNLAKQIASLGSTDTIYAFIGTAHNIGLDKAVEQLKTRAASNMSIPSTYEWASLNAIHERYNARIDPPILENTSGFKCSKCKSSYTTSYTAQIRRVDEGVTTFVVCLAPGCGHRSRF